MAQFASKILCFAVYCCVWLSILGWFGCAQNNQTKTEAAGNLSLWEIADTTCPAAYTVLTLEQWCGLPVSNAEFETLDLFLQQLQQQIPPHTSFTRTEALQILQTIQTAVNSLRTQQVTYHSALYLCLRYRLFDCDINSLLFVTAAQHLNLPVQVLIMPAHMSVVWNDGSNLIYWETTQNREVNLHYYQQKYQLYNKQTQNQPPLIQTLNREQLVAVALFNIGKTFSEMEYAAQALPYFKHALQLWPQWFSPVNAAAHTYLKLNHPDSALLFARHALQLHARQPDMPELMGKAYLMLGCNTEAAEALQLSAQQHAQSRYPDAETILRLKTMAVQAQNGTETIKPQ